MRTLSSNLHFRRRPLLAELTHLGQKLHISWHIAIALSLSPSLCVTGVHGLVARVWLLETADVKFAPRAGMYTLADI